MLTPPILLRPPKLFGTPEYILKFNFEVQVLEAITHGPRFWKIYGVRGINLSSSSIHRESADYDVKGFLPINCTLSLPDVIGEGTFHFFQIFGGGTSKIGGGGFLSDIPYYYIRKSIKYSLQMILEDKFILWNSLHKINQYL